MKNQTLRSIALLAVLCFLAIGMASANAVPSTKLMGMTSPTPKSIVTTFIPFPAAGDAYCGSNNCGTLTAGGETDYMWTAGNYVASAAFTVPGGPIVGLSADWSYENFIGDGNAELWYVFINTTPVAFFIAPDDSYNGDIFSVSGSVSFAPYTVPLASSYTVSLVLQNSLAFGGGSVGFFDGGVTGIDTVPEPGSLALLGSGVVGLAGLLRRKLF
jgi:hypothetical protein